MKKRQTNGQMLKSLLISKGKGNVEERDDWQTPQELFDILDGQYNFSVDCCASENNTKCSVWMYDFLNYDEAFVDEVHWINPPFSKAKEMLDHFFKVVSKGVGIYRCDNMETKIWQEIILEHADWVFIPKGRINYEGKKGNGSVFCSALFGFNVEPPKNLNGITLRCGK